MKKSLRLIPIMALFVFELASLQSSKVKPLPSDSSVLRTQLCAEAQKTKSGVTILPTMITINGNVYHCDTQAPTPEGFIFIRKSDENEILEAVEMLCNFSIRDFKFFGRITIVYVKNAKVPCDFATQVGTYEQITDSKVMITLLQTIQPVNNCSYVYINPNHRAGFLSYTKDSVTWHPNGTIGVYEGKGMVSIDGKEVNNLFSAVPYGLGSCN